MKRILASGSILLAIGVFVFVSTGASNGPSTSKSYRIEMDNAFGLVTGASFKVAGVPAGSISKIDLNQKNLDAVVTVTVSTPGLSTFHANATCQSEPQSLIGEYFISCDPGTSGPVLKNNALIPVSHTSSTIPADQLADIMRMPQRQRLPLIIDSLGAGVAGNSQNLQAALVRAVPALRETDTLLQLLSSDSSTIEDLNHTANQVVTALANNSAAVQHWIDYAGRAARESATQQQNIEGTWHDLPGFLAQLRPTMQKLGASADANLPVLQNLNASATMLRRFFTDLPGFSYASKPALNALGKAGVTGKTALIAAKPTVAELTKFAKHTPELAQNLGIVLPRLNSVKYATEKNSRSPGGKGFTGLEALLQFVFNSSGAINYYGPTGHTLAVDAFYSKDCSPYATPASVASGLASDPTGYRNCYSFLGPNQPGVTTTDPSNPSACVPDPGGSMPGTKGAPTSACKLAAASDQPSAKRAPRTHHARAVKVPKAPKVGSVSPGGVAKTLQNLGQTVSNVLSLLGGSTSSATSGAANTVTTATNAVGSTVSGATGGAGGGTSSSGQSQAQRLLNYLLSP